MYLINATGAGKDNLCRYMVATQDKELRASLSELGVVPLFFMNRDVVLVDPITEANTHKAREVWNVQIAPMQ